MKNNKKYSILMLAVFGLFGQFQIRASYPSESASAKSAPKTDLGMKFVKSNTNYNPERNKDILVELTKLLDKLKAKTAQNILAQMIKDQGVKNRSADNNDAQLRLIGAINLIIEIEGTVKRIIGYDKTVDLLKICLYLLFYNKDMNFIHEFLNNNDAFLYDKATFEKYDKATFEKYDKETFENFIKSNFDYIKLILFILEMKQVDNTSSKDIIKIALLECSSISINDDIKLRDVQEMGVKDQIVRMFKEVYKTKNLTPEFKAEYLSRVLDATNLIINIVNIINENSKVDRVVNLLVVCNDLLDYGKDFSIYNDNDVLKNENEFLNEFVNSPIVDKNGTKPGHRKIYEVIIKQNYDYIKLIFFILGMKHIDKDASRQIVSILSNKFKDIYRQDEQRK